MRRTRFDAQTLQGREAEPRVGKDGGNMPINGWNDRVLIKNRDNAFNQALRAN